jgi:hypothetical protein
MPAMPERPVDAITQAEAAQILGCHVRTVGTHITAGRLQSAAKSMHRALSRADVEALACQVYPWWDHVDDEDSYWITARSARRILGVNHTRLNQLAVRGFVPFEVHADGTRLYRREQLEVVANGSRCASGGASSAPDRNTETAALRAVSSTRKTWGGRPPGRPPTRCPDSAQPPTGLCRRPFTTGPGRCPPPILLSRDPPNHSSPRPGIARWKAYFFRLGQIFLWGRRRTAS